MAFFKAVPPNKYLDELILKQISINGTFNMGRTFTPKKKSGRQINLAPMAVKTLAKWKLANGGKDNNLVFPNEAGGPINYSSMVQRYFHKGLKDAKISRINFHDLRHTYASLLLAKGENVKYIQTQLGIHPPPVTLKVYAHLMKGQTQEAACMLENSITSTGQIWPQLTNKGLQQKP